MSNPFGLGTLTNDAYAALPSIFGSNSKNLIGSSKNVVGSSTNLFGSSKNLLGSSVNLLGSSKNLLGSSLSDFTSFATPSNGSSVKTKALKISLVLFAIAIIVAIVYALSFIWKRKFSSTASLPKTGTALWTGPETLSQTSNMNMKTDASGSITRATSEQYTVSFEMQIQAPFSNTNLQRHIFHRGDPITAKIDTAGNLTGSNAGNLTGSNTGNLTDIQAANYTGVVQLTGPYNALLNPGVFLASDSTNSLWITIQDGSGKNSVETIVNDVPVFRPFRVTIAVSSFVMDIYIDCKLAQTVYLQASVPKSTPTTIFGHLSAGFPGIVGNVQFYNIPLSAQQVALICKQKRVLTLFNSDYSGSSCAA